MSASRKIDMTKGRMIPLVAAFALPLFLGNVLQQLYHTADTMVVGNFCGANSLAAVATSAQPVELLVQFFTGIGGGVSILVAQYVGAGEQKRLKSLLGTAVTFLYLCSIFVTVAGFALGPYILQCMQVPADVFSLASDYIRIIFAGTLASLGYNMNAGVLRGLGDSSSSLLFLVVSCLLNIVLDVLFVAVLRMDISGAAAATVISQFVSWFLSIAYIRIKYPEMDFPILPRKMEKDLVKEIARISLPLGANHSFYSVGHLLMQSLINAQGAVFIAGCAVSSKVIALSNSAIQSMAMATTTFAGQNYGAKQYARVRKAARIPFVTGGLSLLSAIVFLIFARPMLMLFTQDPAVLEISILYMHVVLPFTCCYAVFNGIINLANGIGEVRYPTIVNILMLWVVRIPTGHFIAHFIGGRYVMAAISFSFVVGMLAMFFFFFRSHRWKEVCMLAKAQAA